MSQGTQGVCSPLPRGSGHQGDYTMGFLGTTGGTSWALSSWVWAHREFTFTASQLEFTKCCRKGPKPGTKDRLVCSGQAWAEVSVSALLPPPPWGPLVAPGAIKDQWGLHAPLSCGGLQPYQSGSISQVLLCEVLWRSPRGMRS